MKRLTAEQALYYGFPEPVDYKIYCDGKKHYTYVRCMYGWMKSEEIECLCCDMRKALDIERTIDKEGDDGQ